MLLMTLLHVSVVSQKGADKLGYEAEAFAIYDTMRFVKPPVGTVCVGSAYGEAAMLLAAGEKVRLVSHQSVGRHPVHIAQPPLLKSFESHHVVGFSVTSHHRGGRGCEMRTIITAQA